MARRGEVVGEGHTQPPGGDHAEVIALRQAGDLAMGAELFISLEPCSRHGRTPPCTDAITAAGISRVHVGAIDPNPAENGRGLDRLREAGVEVMMAADPSESLAASRLIGAYRKHSATGTPFVTSKFAMSLDGKIADRTGRSKWITGEPARARAHELRAESDAILVGIGTIVADDPRLTARDPGRAPDRTAAAQGGRRQQGQGAAGFGCDVRRRSHFDSLHRHGRVQEIEACLPGSRGGGPCRVTTVVWTLLPC